MEDFLRDVTREHLHLLTPEERCRGLSAEDTLGGLTVDERLAGLPTEVVEDYLRELRAEELEAQPEVQSNAKERAP
jgi:hypothetical protein